jgi:hypothetical protein
MMSNREFKCTKMKLLPRESRWACRPNNCWYFLTLTLSYEFLAMMPEITNGNPNDYKSLQAHGSTIVAFPQRSIPKGIKSKEGWAE